MQIDPLFSFTAQYFLAVLFLVSSLHKALHWQMFTGIVTSYQLAPASLVNSIALIITGTELILSILLITQFANFWAGIISISLLGLYFCGMAINIHRGHRAIDCGCSFIGQKTPLSHWHLLRNATLIVFSLALLSSHPQREFTTVDVFQIVPAILCLGVLYLAVDSLLANNNYLQKEEV